MPAPSTVENVNIGVGATDKASPALAGIAGGLINVKTAALGAGAAVAAFAVKSVQEFAEFQAAMRESYVMFEDFAQGMRDEMEYITQQIATSSEHTAKDVAEAWYFMGSAGLTAVQSIKQMQYVSKFATATNLSVADSAETAAIAMNAFGKSAEQVPNVLDAMAATERSAMTTQKQLMDAFSYTAPIAATFGQNIETVNAAIGMMANAGLQGSKAGVALRRVITNLAAPLGRSADAIKEMGIQVYEAGSHGAQLHEQLVQTESQITTLTGKVEDYKMELMGLKDTQRGLAMATNKAQLKIMKIRHRAEREGRRLTRSEERRIEELKQKKQGLRIESMENRIAQQKVNDSMKDAQYQKKKLQRRSGRLQEQLRAESGDMRNLVDILVDMDKITSDMSTPRRNELLTWLAGKRGVSGMLAMMSGIRTEGKGMQALISDIREGQREDIVPAMAKEVRDTLSYKFEQAKGKWKMAKYHFGGALLPLLGEEGLSKHQQQTIMNRFLSDIAPKKPHDILSTLNYPFRAAFSGAKLMSPLLSAPEIWRAVSKPVKPKDFELPKQPQTKNVNVNSNTHVEATVHNHSDVQELATQLANLSSKGIIENIEVNATQGG